MIQTKEDLKRYLAADYGRTELGIRGRTLRGRLCREPYYLFWRYIRALRMEEYHTSQDGAWHKLMHYWWRRRRNLLGEKTGLGSNREAVRRGCWSGIPMLSFLLMQGLEKTVRSMETM